MMTRTRAARSTTMQDPRCCGNSGCARAAAGHCGEHGVALILTLLLLSLMAILGLAMVWALSSDMLINGYYRNFRGSFYAADSGINIARQQLVNQVTAAFPSAWAIPPLSNQTATATAALNYLSANYGSFTSLNAGQAASSWSESFEIVNTPKCTNTFAPAVGYPQVTSTNPSTSQPTGYRYIFNYTLCSTGRALAAQQVNVSETGSVTVNLTGQAASATVSFSAFGGFVANYPSCLAPLVPGTMTGMMSTNGQWQFYTGGPYIFTDLVTQENPNFGYWFGGNCIQSSQPTYQSGGQTIKPTFQGSPSPGYQLGQPALAMPANAFSQEWAALDGEGCGEGSNVCGNNSTPPPPQPTSADLSNYLKNIADAPYPATGATSGVYLGYSTTDGVNTMQGGGIYVEGSAGVLLATSGSSAQVFTITQGSTSTTVTIDPLATPPASWNCAPGTKGTTIAKSGSATSNICSVPMNYSLTPPQAATMLYVDGTITSLSGPGQGVGAIQNYNAVTITANGNIDITGDVVYATEPVTTTQNQIVPGTNPPCCNGTPVATLIPGNDYGQDFGLFTATGNINLQTSYANSNLQVDGSQAAIGQNCASSSCGFTVSGCINTFNNVGGQIQSNIFGACMSTENTYFDRRYTSKPGFAPPWFPSTTLTQGGAQPTNLSSSVQRVTWLTSPQ
jgi:Tfp pilus assembly protein PilX